MGLNEWSRERLRKCGCLSCKEQLEHPTTLYLQKFFDNFSDLIKDFWNCKWAGWAKYPIFPLFFLIYVTFVPMTCLIMDLQILVKKEINRIIFQKQMKKT